MADNTQTPKLTSHVIRKGQRTIEKNFNTLEALRVIYVPHDWVTPNSYNPNRQADEEHSLLIASMSEDGFTQPIVVRPLFTHEQACEALGLSTTTLHTEIDWREAASLLGRGFEIVDGEHRWKAAGTLGYADIPVVVTNMTEEQMRIATLRHNRARGSEDIALTAQVLRDLEKMGALDHAVDSLQLDEVEIQKLINEVTVPDEIGNRETYSQSWEPDRSVLPVTNEADNFFVASTRKAVDAQRETEKRMGEAKSAEERQMIQRDSDIHRMMLVFRGEEAKLVRKILGHDQAEQLVAICREYATNHQIEI